MTHSFLYHSPLGPLTLTFDGEALSALRFGSQASSTAPSSVSPVRWLDRYFSGHQPTGLPPLDLHGTDFQLRVWKALLEIPYGHTVSYGELARRLGCRSAQAVGQAVGKNPVAIIVPCHRVVGADGSLTGYAYGLDIKQKLLQLETI